MSELNLVKSNKPRKTASIVYLVTGVRGSVRIARTVFENGDAPATLSLTGENFAGPRVAKTAEERKAARKAAPKLTPAQKLAKLEARAARLRAKVEGTPTPEAQPVGV